MKKDSYKVIFAIVCIIYVYLYFCTSFWHWFSSRVINFVEKLVPSVTTWTISDIQNSTWTVEINEPNVFTWEAGVYMEIPNNPRDYLDYLLEYWTWWYDYFVSTPSNQPNMNSQASTENTSIMHNYIHKNRIRFDLGNQNKKWYIIFLTKIPVSNISNIFLWVDWKTIWWLDKNKRILTQQENEFMYELDKVYLIWNNNYHFSENLNKPVISINAVVWQADNKIEKIIIFFK